ncbi:response regulator transcription factor [Leucobacter sp. USCH14]|uniref:response regulator transcription factor n=1 Tax=Leucobacter sp. USCH14 TaxID=3024838 RepID=UPI0030AFD57E
MIRVLLVDDQALVRSGFRIILESEPDIEVVGEAENGEIAVALAVELRPDVICMDVEMPVLDGIEASRRILAPGSAAGAPAVGSGATGATTNSAAADGAAADGAAADGAAASSAPAILVLTTFGHERYLFDALAAGVSGFLLKTARAEQLIDAVHSLAAGNALLGSDVTRAVIERVSANSPANAAAPTGHGDPEPITVPDAAAAAMEAAGLTEREREVLALVAEGKSNGEIAAALFLGEATIKTHVSNLLQKLGVRDRIQAVVWAHTRS